MRSLRLLLAALTLAAPASAARVRSAPARPLPAAALMRLTHRPLPLVSPTRAFSLTPSLALTRASALRPVSAAAAVPTAAAMPAAVPAAARRADEPSASAEEAPAAPARAMSVRQELARLSALRGLQGAGLEFAAARLALAFDGRGLAFTPEGTAFGLRASAGGTRLVRIERAPSAETRPVPGTEGLSGAALLEAVGRAARRNHRVHDYKAASDYLFSRADNVEVGGVRGVVDGYSGVFVPGTSTEGGDYPERGDRNGDGHVDSKGMNVEHIWPQGHFDQRLPMRSDLHHLMTTFMHPNSERGNIPFGVARGRIVYRNDAGSKSDGEVFEPADFVKGRVARAMLYFYARYRGERIFLDRSGVHWWERQIQTLLDWNRRFPPDAEESARNDRVEAFQGSRNPLVDDHKLADRIGADALRPAAPRAAASGRRHGRRKR